MEIELVGSINRNQDFSCLVSHMIVARVVTELSSSSGKKINHRKTLRCSGIWYAEETIIIKITYYRCGVEQVMNTINSKIIESTRNA